MTMHIFLSNLLIVAVVLVFSGCSSSEKSGTNSSGVVSTMQQPKEAVTKETVEQPKQGEDPAQKKPPEPMLESVSTGQQIPFGKFGVQVGAYTNLDNAESVAAAAKRRFSRNVYTVYDKTQNLFKVMVGDFTTKDDARQFRDRIVQQYPGEYTDAWVSEFTR